MPIASAKKPAPTATVQETVIRKEVRDPVEMPVTPPASHVEPSEDFWEYIGRLTPEDWREYHCTLYRYPLGQPKPQKVGRYIRAYKFGSPLLNEDQVAEEFGGGQYDAWLKGPKNGQRLVLLAKYAWEIDGPPKNPWQDSRNPNASAPSELAATLQVVLQNLQNAQKSGNPGADPAVSSSIALIKQLTDALPKQQGITELVAGLASLKQLTGETETQGGLRETLSLLKELGFVGQERKSLATEIKEIFEVAGMFGGGGSAKTDWATTLVTSLPTILEKATPIADRFAETSRNNARVAEIRAGRIPQEPSLPAPRPVTSAPAAAAPAAESPAPRVVAAPETEPASAPSQAAGPGIAPQAPNLDWVKARAVQLFAEGKRGDEIADWLDKLDEQLGNMLGAMDAEQFSLFVRTDPILSQISLAPVFNAFVAEFVSYFAEEPQQTKEK